MPHRIGRRRLGVPSLHVDELEQTVVEYEGVRIDLSHVHEASRRPMIAEARLWIDSGERPPLLTVRVGGVDVSTRPELWPAEVRDYRGPGRLEWVGIRD
jgi:hypothetical protein